MWLSVDECVLSVKVKWWNVPASVKISVIWVLSWLNYLLQSRWPLLQQQPAVSGWTAIRERTLSRHLEIVKSDQDYKDYKWWSSGTSGTRRGRSLRRFVQEIVDLRVIFKSWDHESVIKFHAHFTTRIWLQIEIIKYKFSICNPHLWIGLT